MRFRFMRMSLILSTIVLCSKTPALAQQVPVSVSAVNFGNVLVGQPSTKTATVTNVSPSSGEFSRTFQITGISAVENPNGGCPPGRSNAFKPSQSQRNTTLKPGQSARIDVTFAPATAGSYCGLLQIDAHDVACPPSSCNVRFFGTLSGTASSPPPPPMLAAVPAGLDFGDQLVNVESGAQPVTIRNTGRGCVRIDSVAITGQSASASSNEFRIKSEGCKGQILTPGLPNETCKITVAFLPLTAGTRGANLTIIYSSADCPFSTNSVRTQSVSATNVLTVPLSGRGIAPAISVNPNSLAFGNRLVGSSTSQNITVSNTGTAPLVIRSISLTNTRDFALLSGGGPVTLQPRQSLTVIVAFIPSNSGSIGGNLLIVSNAGNVSVPLSGTGTAAAGVPGILVSPALLDFSQILGSTNVPQAVTITSTGTAPLTVNSIRITGQSAGSFAISADSGGSLLQPGQRRTLSIRFAPTTVGSYSASLRIESNAAGSPHSVPLTALVSAARAPTQRGNGVGDPVAANGRLELFGADPPAPDSAVTAVTGVGDDGALTVLDYAGTALLRAPLAGGPAQILLDTTRANVQGGVGLARLQQVKSSRSGVHAVQALRADNSRAIFRLDRATFSLLAALPGSRGLAELAISDAGQIAYVAPLDSNPGSPLTLFLALPGQQPRALFSVGALTSSGLTVTGIRSLQSNAAGVLTYILDLRDSRGLPLQAVMRGTNTEQVAVALTGQPITGVPGPLTEVRKPRIGPDGTIVFQGSGNGFVNFFAGVPGRTLTPLLRSDNWNTADGSFDYDIGAGGAIAVRAQLASSSDSALYLVGPAGSVDVIVSGRRDLQPTAQPVFGSDNRLFFLAQNLDLPIGRNGLPETGLYRSRRVGGQLVLEAVAMPEQPVPGWTNVRLLGITQRPVVAGNDLIFGVLFGGPESLPVPTAALFRVPLDGALAAGTLLSPEGTDENEASRLAMLRDLSYRGDGSLVFYGLLPGAGPVVAPSIAPVTIASLFRTQALQAALPITPLIATGDNLGSAGQLENTLPPLLSLGPDRELFVARTSRSQTVPRQSDNEGLFTVRPGKLVDPAAVSHRTFPGFSDTTFNGFADIKALMQPLGPPSIGTDGRVVFKALLDRNRTQVAGIFQWVPGTDPVLIRGPEDPELLMGWAAGRSGVNYILERSSSAGSSSAQLLAGSGSLLQAVAPVGVTPEMLQVRPDGGILLVTNGSGDLFVVGGGPAGAGVYRLVESGLVPVATQGSPVSMDRNDAGFNFNFASGFELAPDSARGDLIFRATVQRPGGAQMRGEFELDRGQSVPFTRNIGSLDLTSARTLAVDPLGTTMPVQSRNGISVSARFDAGTNSWSLIRFQLANGRVSQVTIAQDKRGDPNSRFAALDTGALLQQEADVRVPSGPVFTINDAGDVAFLASDGQTWGVYQFPAR